MPKQNSVSVTAVDNMGDDALAGRAWEILTNVRQCGGGTRKGYRLAQRRMRRLGYRFYMVPSYGEGSRWGILKPGEKAPDGSYVGVSLNHCAHKIGGGNATEGWRMFF